MPAIVVLALALATWARAGVLDVRAPTAALAAPPIRVSCARTPDGGRRQGPQPILLELRVFLGSDEVTSQTRVTVHRAGERTQRVAQLGGQGGPIELSVPAGLYDVQAIREVDGKVANIRWAERLVVMPYPDEGGHHLEVVNFTSGFGALQVRGAQPNAVPDVGLYAAGRHDRPAATRVAGPDYVLFVVPTGKYDVEVRTGGKAAWDTGIEVPLDRTRLWVVR